MYSLFHVEFLRASKRFSAQRRTHQGKLDNGIPFIDSIRLGSQKNLPESWKSNPSRNTYFMLPFLLGIFQVVPTIQRTIKTRGGDVILLLTGLAIVVYTNHKPYEPRERDYAFVGSFYAYAIWIGIGALGLWDTLRTKMSPMVASYLVIGVMVAVPVRMAAKNGTTTTEATDIQQEISQKHI